MKTQTHVYRQAQHCRYDCLMAPKTDQVANTRNAQRSFKVSEEGWEKSGLSRLLWLCDVSVDVVGPELGKPRFRGTMEVTKNFFFSPMISVSSPKMKSKSGFLEILMTQEKKICCLSCQVSGLTIPSAAADWHLRAATATRRAVSYCSELENVLSQL